jgi:O-antigen/teichoic acid export membrane protein
LSEPDGAGDGDGRSFASGARILSIGIASTGIFTFAYLATSSHVLSKGDYGLISLCWSIMFVILSVIYRPIEQLLSRTIADRRARGLSGHPLRIPAAIQSGFALLFIAVSLSLRSVIVNDVFQGSSVLFWILFVGVIAYAASYFARGWLAGHQYFALYGGLVFLESTSRFLFPLAVAIGIGSGIGVVGLGMAVAPFASLAVMPFALPRIRSAGLRRLAAAPDTADAILSGSLDDEPEIAEVPVFDAGAEGPAAAQIEETTADLSIRRGAGFAVSVVGIMFSEQALMNAGVLIVAASAGGTNITGGLTGFVFNIMLIVRAPLQLFQAIQTSILPHLAGLEARESADEFRHAINVTVLAIAAFGLAVALGLLLIGPEVMKIFFSSKAGQYNRFGLALVGLGMGLHLISGTLNQAALARGRTAMAAACWLTAAALFVGFQLVDIVASQVWRVEVGYFGATAVLCVLLWLLYRRGSAEAAGSADRARHGATRAVPATPR